MGCVFLELGSGSEHWRWAIEVHISESSVLEALEQSEQATLKVRMAQNNTLNYLEALVLSGHVTLDPKT